MFTKEKLIIELPKVDYNLYFTKDSILFLAIIISILFSVVMCLWGHHYFKVIAEVLAGAGIMAAGMILLDPIISSPTVKMFLLVLLVFVSMSIVLSLITHVFKKDDKNKAQAGTGRFYRVVAPIVGAGLLFGVFYTCVYCDIVFDAIVAMVFACLGYLNQIRTRGHVTVFRTYDDIYYGR
ncbi:MAG: hypothetical protein J5802_06160 [Butyrivibrio sp.]|nr:hypothetical protein [Butyrivibrio sp.]